MTLPVREHAASRFLGLHAGRHLLVQLQGGKALELLAQLGVMSVATDEGRKATGGDTQALHASPPWPRNRATIAVVCDHSRDARAISARPLRVSA